MLYYSNYLLENGLESNVIAFRKITEIDALGKKRSLCNIHFARNVFDFIKEKTLSQETTLTNEINLLNIPSAVG